MLAMGPRALMAGCLATATYGQQVGKEQAETHLQFPVQECSEGGSCNQQEGGVVLDMQWRWLHDKDGYSHCLEEGSKGGWDSSLCPDAESCSRSCAVEGVTADDYSKTYGVDPVEGGVKLSYVAPKGNIASRLYVMQDDDNYRLFQLKNREFSVTVDVSALPCGLNGAIYFVEMPQNGGLDGDLNSAGAKYGTGYCDAQCPRGMKFVKGLANTDGYGMIEEMTPDLKTVKVGPYGEHGACCAEMDIYEANSATSSFTAHPCSFQGTKSCKGTEECGDKSKGYLSECDKNGCGMNSYQQGNHDFFGEGKDVDSSKPVTLVTQFHTSDGTDEGDLSEIRRLFIQDGKVVKQASAKNVPGHPDSITDKMCGAMAKEYNETLEYNFAKMGGLKSMGEALSRGMVLTLSIWDDALTRMLWLDSSKIAADKDPKQVGQTRGPCSFKSGNAEKMHESNKDASVTFTDVKSGPIGSTFKEDAAPVAKFAIDDAVKTALSAQSATAGMPLAFAAAALGAAFLAVVASSVVLRMRQLRQLSPSGHPDEESILAE